MEKQSWNKFILANHGSFLQSWEWGEFQESFGRRTLRLSGDNWAAQFIENKLPGVNKFYWYAPKGPVFSLRQAQAINSQDYSLSEAKRVEGLILRVKKAAGKDVIFFRLGPAWPLDCHSDPAVAGEGSKKDSSAFGLRMTDSLYKIGFKHLPYDIEPSQTQILDVTKSEDELLAQMHEKWRYNIRLAERKGVIVKNFQYPIPNDQFEKFYELVEKGTSERKGIKHHPKDYYRKQLQINNPPTPLCVRGEEENFCERGAEEITPLVKGGVGGLRTLLFIAEYGNKVIAANIVVIFGSSATYLHGATSSEHREVMAPHLLQWEQIKYAKSQGCAEYDFWGIVNEHTLDKRGQSWEGFTRFKRGFGGQEVNYVGYFDYPLNRPWYFLYRLIQKFRR